MKLILEFITFYSTWGTPNKQDKEVKCRQFQSFKTAKKKHSLEMGRKQALGRGRSVEKLHVTQESSP
jgi:hypothetical protein